MKSPDRRPLPPRPHPDAGGIGATPNADTFPMDTMEVHTTGRRYRKLMKTFPVAEDEDRRFLPQYQSGTASFPHESGTKYVEQGPVGGWDRSAHRTGGQYEYRDPAGRSVWSMGPSALAITEERRRRRVWAFTREQTYDVPEDIGGRVNRNLGRIALGGLIAGAVSYVVYKLAVEVPAFKPHIRAGWEQAAELQADQLKYMVDRKVEGKEALLVALGGVATLTLVGLNLAAKGTRQNIVKGVRKTKSGMDKAGKPLVKMSEKLGHGVNKARAKASPYITRERMRSGAQRVAGAARKLKPKRTPKP